MTLLVQTSCLPTPSAEVIKPITRERDSADWIVLKATDAERERIGADLHDGLGQQLTGISCIATALAKRTRHHHPDVAEMASLLSRLSLEAITQAQALARGLCPVTIQERGLVPAVEELMEQCRRLHRVTCKISVRGTTPQLEPTRALQIYRIIQEGMTNAARHGAAQRIHVGIFQRTRRLTVIVLDDGDGFDPATESHSNGRGLRLMRHRAELIGAKLNLYSRPGWGTRIACTLNPLSSTYVP